MSGSNQGAYSILLLTPHLFDMRDRRPLPRLERPMPTSKVLWVRDMGHQTVAYERSTRQIFRLGGNSSSANCTSIWRCSGLRRPMHNQHAFSYKSVLHDVVLLLRRLEGVYLTHSTANAFGLRSKLAILISKKLPAGGPDQIEVEPYAKCKVVTNYNCQSKSHLDVCVVVARRKVGKASLK